MSRVTVLGGAGTVGTVAVKTLLSSGSFSEVVIADLDEKLAKRRLSEIGDERLSAVQVDATDAEAVKRVIKDSDVVVNCAGPFYRLGPVILRAVIDAGIDCVDVCDDFDATKILLKMDEDAKKAEITALTGMGSSPGIANLLAKFCAEQMLDEVESIDILHAHGGEPREGPAVVAHRIHSMLADIPMYLDGKFTTVRYFEESGKALEEDVYFPKLGTFRCYPYPHPETITLPRYIKCKRVTNLGCVLPTEYYDLIRNIVRLGIVGEEPIDVRGAKVAPLDFAIAYILHERERILRETNFGTQRGCLKITVKGKLDGKPHRFDFSLVSVGQSMGEGTGIPAAIGAILMQKGKITEKGVLPPEGCVNPFEFLLEMQKHLGLESLDSEESPLIIESTDSEGNVERATL